MSPKAIKAVTEDVIERLYNSILQISPPQKGKTGLVVPFDNDELTNWAGYRMRVMLYAIYTISFLCMLRFGEVLKIQVHHIEVLDKDQESGEIRLTLPFRKIYQGGST